MGIYSLSPAYFSLQPCRWFCVRCFVANAIKRIHENSEILTSITNNFNISFLQFWAIVYNCSCFSQPHLHTFRCDFSVKDSLLTGPAAVLFDNDCVKPSCSLSLGQLWTVVRLDTAIAEVMQSYHALWPLRTFIRFTRRRTMLHSWRLLRQT